MSRKRRSVPQQQQPNAQPTQIDLRTLSSLLAQRMQFAGDYGLTYTKNKGYAKRDLYKALGYADTISPEQYRGRFERGGIARTLVMEGPRATWAGNVFLVDDEDPDTQTPFEEAFGELAGRLRLWDRFRRADVLASIGEYACLLIGVADEAGLEQPLPEKFRAEQVLYLRPLGQDKATIERYVEDSSDQRYGQPEFYTLNLGEGSGRQRRRGSGGARVHWSRIVHLCESPLDNDVFGEPALRAVWNYLDDLDKCVGGGSEATWRQVNALLHLDLDPAAKIDPDVQAAMEAQLDEVIHGFRNVLQTRGIEASRIAGEVPKFGENVDKLLDLIAGTRRIPKRKLVGSERGELASSQDDDNWSETIQARRKQDAETWVRSFVDRLIVHGALPEPSTGSYAVAWPERSDTDIAKQAAVASKMAAANASHISAALPPVLTTDEIRDRVYGLEPIEVEDLRSAKMARKLARERKAAAALAPVDAQTRQAASGSSIADAADRLEDGLAAVVTRLPAEALDSLSGVELAGMLLTRNTDAAVDAAMQARSAAVEEIEQPIAEELSVAFLEGARIGANKIPSSRRPARPTPLRAAAAQVNFDFTSGNPFASAWARTRAASLIREVFGGAEVEREVREALRSMIAASIEDGVAPQALAQQIRQAVGLRADQIEAISRLRRELATSEPGTLVTRFQPQPTLRKNPGFRVRIPDGGASEGWISRQLGRYAEMQANLRGRTIARTELSQALSAGQQQLWAEAQQQGFLTADDKREWVTAGDSAVRDEHALHHGQKVGLNDPWPWGYGPGEEVNCRCDEVISVA